METTMLVGERFFADKLSYLFKNPTYGDIISFNAPPPFYQYSDNVFVNLFQNYVWGPPNWTKRIIGCPGDHVRGVIEDGKPVIYLTKAGSDKEEKLDELYLNKYPIIRVWKEDPAKLREQIDREIEKASAKGGLIDSIVLNRILEQRLEGQMVHKSYDPMVPFDQQSFYRIHEERIFRGPEGQIEELYPGTPTSADNGQKITRNTSYWTGTDEFDVMLGHDEYWGMGDNRLGSKDCRVFGPIKRKLIHGRIIFRIWSVDSDESWWILDLIMHPVDFWSRVRWGRFFQLFS